jgi:membrane associated rhomboid family serine protease
VRDADLYYEQSLAPPASPVVVGLIIANVAVFLVQVTLSVASVRFDPVHWFGLNPWQLADLHVWQLITYMFLHSVDDPFHIIFNMLFLYFFGRDIEAMLGSRRFLVFYLTAGVIGGLLFCAIHPARSLGLPLIGASGAVMATMVLYACYWPKRIILLFFLFPIAVKWCVLLFVGLDLFWAVRLGGGGSLAHFGGAAYGFLFWRMRPVIAAWRERRAVARESAQAHDDEDDEKKLDEILEKVHTRGLNALTRREKKFLREMSRRISSRS